ncbi:MAG: hypothetical protein UZ22_OP11002001118 [Microgenomates bacterium OLB23]|nr:MAG: hypothetical protein UZ22_OP11002001118 [Microgenomates bacterium OLB23]
MILLQMLLQQEGTHKNAVVAATTGLLQRLERAEIEGVIAHELSHVKNYDILVMSIVGVLVGTIVFVADMAMRSLFGVGVTTTIEKATLLPEYSLLHS